MGKVGSINFNFSSIETIDNFEVKSTFARTEECISFFLMQSFPNYVINMQNKLDQILPLLSLVQHFL